MSDRTCIACGRPVTGRVLKCRDCVRAYRAETDYRAETIRRDGYHCADCWGWWNALIVRFYAWRRGPHVQPVKVLLWLLRIRRYRRVEVDHIRRLADGGTHARHNLQVLCRRHHKDKTRREGWAWRRRRHLNPKIAAAALLVGGAFLAGAASPPQVNGWVAAGLAAAAVLCVVGAVRMWLRKSVLDRLWNAELVGLPRTRVTNAWSHSQQLSRFEVRKGWGRGLKGSRWGWRRIPGDRWVDRLPRYQPDRIVVRHRGWHLNPEMQAEAEEKVSAMLGRPYRGRWDPARDRGVLVPVPPLPERVGPFGGSPEPSKLLIGMGEDGPAGWDTVAAPHLLVVGGTGTGKTSTLRAVADAALTAGWAVSVGDPKRIELRSLQDRVEGYATDMPRILNLISGVRSLMDDRYVDLEKRLRTLEELEPVLLVIDEVAELVDRAKVIWRNPPDGSRGHGGDPPVLADLGSLARLGRSARVHLAVGIQRPDVRWLEGAARDQYGCRVACGPMSVNGSQMIFGDGRSARRVEDHPGRVLMQTGAAEPCRMQVAWVPDDLPPLAAEPPMTAADS